MMTLKPAPKFIAEAEEVMNLWEMSNFRQKTTGLPMVIWIITKSGNERHGPRLKVQNNHDTKFSVHNTVTVTIDDNPRVIPERGLSNADLKIVSEFIAKNKKALIDHWNGELDSNEFVQEMKKLD